MTKPNRTEVARALALIDEAQRHMTYVAAHLADVHSLAYEPQVGERSGGGSAGSSDKIGGFVGAEKGDGAIARAICEAVIGYPKRSKSLEAATVWAAIATGMQGLLGGAGGGHALRGTLIGSAEYDEQIAAQRRRRARAGDPSTANLAEYEPVPDAGQRQPRYPGPRGTRVVSGDRLAELLAGQRGSCAHAKVACSKCVELLAKEAG